MQLSGTQQAAGPPRCQWSGDLHEAVLPGPTGMEPQGSGRLPGMLGLLLWLRWPQTPEVGPVGPVRGWLLQGSGRAVLAKV